MQHEAAKRGLTYAGGGGGTGFGGET
jgi:hypothetical protein